MTTKRKPSMDELFASMKEGCEATYYEYEVQLSKLTAQRDELLSMARNLSDSHYSTEAQKDFERQLCKIEGGMTL